jgi:hypothetical protein
MFQTSNSMSAPGMQQEGEGNSMMEVEEQLPVQTEAPMAKIANAEQQREKMLVAERRSERIRVLNESHSPAGHLQHFPDTKSKSTHDASYPLKQTSRGHSQIKSHQAKPQHEGPSHPTEHINLSAGSRARKSGPVNSVHYKERSKPERK